MVSASLTIHYKLKCYRIATCGALLYIALSLNEIVLADPGTLANHQDIREPTKTIRSLDNSESHYLSGQQNANTLVDVMCKISQLFLLKIKAPFIAGKLITIKLVSGAALAINAILLKGLYAKLLVALPQAIPFKNQIKVSAIQQLLNLTCVLTGSTGSFCDVGAAFPDLISTLCTQFALFCTTSTVTSAAAAPAPFAPSSAAVPQTWSGPAIRYGTASDYGFPNTVHHGNIQYPSFSDFNPAAQVAAPTSFGDGRHHSYPTPASPAPGTLTWHTASETHNSMATHLNNGKESPSTSALLDKDDENSLSRRRYGRFASVGDLLPEQIASDSNFESPGVTEATLYPNIQNRQLREQRLKSETNPAITTFLHALRDTMDRTAQFRERLLEFQGTVNTIEPLESYINIQSVPDARFIINIDGDEVIEKIEQGIFPKLETKLDGVLEVLASAIGDD